MMSAFADASQRAKKKMAPLSKPSSTRPRGSQNTVPSVSDASQAASKTPVKDIYDYDFVDDVAPAPRTATKPRPFSTAKPTNKTTTTSSSASLSASPLPASTTPRQPSTAQRNPVSRGAVEAARSLKRKPSQLDTTPSQRPSGYTAASSVSSTSRSTGTQQAKRVQRSSPSPDHAAGATTPPLYKQNRAVGKVAAVGKTAQSSPARQRVTKTPPRNTARLKSPISMRSPSASPRKTPSGQYTLLATSIRKAQPAPAANHVPYRSVDGPSSGSTPKRTFGTLPSSLPASATSEKPARKVAASPRQPPPPRATPAARPTSTPAPQTSTHRKRRRLIDTLVDQMEEESSSDEDEKPQQKTAEAGDDDASSEADTILSKYRNIRSTPMSEDRLNIMELESIVTGSPSKPPLAPSTPATITRTQQSRRKFVYNVQRTMLAEDPVALGGPQGSDLSMLESLLPDSEPKQDSYDFDDDTGPSQGAIQSIHELRQAGANSRYADELVDIMDRVGGPSTSGKPNSARRGALIELAQKLQEKSFLRQFRDQGADLKLFGSVGKETDTIAGYTMTCIAVSLFASGSVSPRLLREFQQHKIKDLFALLLEVDVDIEAVTKSRDPRDRKNRTSPHMSQQLVGLREAMKKNLSIWKPATVAPSKLSPRTITLKALHMFAAQLQAASGGVLTGLDEDDGALSASLTKELFGIISSALPSPYDDGYDFDDDDDGGGGGGGGDSSGKTAAAPPSVLATGLTSSPKSADVYLALSLLEMHSVSAMQSDISAEWTRNYLPIIASALADSLVHHQTEQQGRSHRLNDMELLVLKLALNTANNNPDAARFYVEKGLLRQLAELSAVSLAAVVRSAKTGEEYASDALNELLLMLGVMINFSENDSAAGETLAQGGGGLVLLGKLGKTFLDGRAIAAEADSEEKSQLNVAFAYLSILLGYLCLHEPIYQEFRQLSPSRSLSPLLESIRHFINLHDQLGKAESSEHGAEASHFTARLRALAHELEVRAY